MCACTSFLIAECGAILAYRYKWKNKFLFLVPRIRVTSAWWLEVRFVSASQILEFDIIDARCPGFGFPREIPRISRGKGNFYQSDVISATGI